MIHAASSYREELSPPDGGVLTPSQAEDATKALRLLGYKQGASHQAREASAQATDKPTAWVKVSGIKAKDNSLTVRICEQAKFVHDLKKFNVAMVHAGHHEVTYPKLDNGLSVTVEDFGRKLAAALRNPLVRAKISEGNAAFVYQGSMTSSVDDVGELIKPEDFFARLLTSSDAMECLWVRPVRRLKSSGLLWDAFAAAHQVIQEPSALQLEASDEATIPEEETPSDDSYPQPSLRERLLSSVPMMNSREISKLSGLGKDNPSHLAGKWREGNKIFGVRHGNQLFYPAFQFNATGHTIPGLDRVLKALPERYGEWDRLMWFVSHTGSLRGGRPCDLIISDPDRVERAARMEAEDVDGDFDRSDNHHPVTDS